MPSCKILRKKTSQTLHSPTESQDTLGTSMGRVTYLSLNDFWLQKKVPSNHPMHFVELKHLTKLLAQHTTYHSNFWITSSLRLFTCWLQPMDPKKDPRGPFRAAPVDLKELHLNSPTNCQGGLSLEKHNKRLISISLCK